MNAGLESGDRHHSRLKLELWSTATSEQLGSISPHYCWPAPQSQVNIPDQVFSNGGKKTCQMFVPRINEPMPFPSTRPLSPAALAQGDPSECHDTRAQKLTGHFFPVLHSYTPGNKESRQKANLSTRTLRPAPKREMLHAKRAIFHIPFHIPMLDGLTLYVDPNQNPPGNAQICTIQLL